MPDPAGPVRWWWVARRGWKYRHVICSVLMPPGTVDVQAACDRWVRLVALKHGYSAALPDTDCPRCRRRWPNLAATEPTGRAHSDRRAADDAHSLYQMHYREDRRGEAADA